MGPEVFGQLGRVLPTKFHCLCAGARPRGNAESDVIGVTCLFSSKTRSKLEVIHWSMKREMFPYRDRADDISATDDPRQLLATDDG